MAVDYPGVTAKLGAMLTRSELCRQLRETARVKAGDILIVHSSFKSLGPVEGGPATVVGALQDAVTDAGALLMPVFTWPQADGIFHLKTSPSRTGAITEAFRTTSGVLRSRHPTHSVAAWGAQAAELIEGHPRTSALGWDSPFHRATLAGASVLMIGCRMTSCSLVHVAEALAKVPYLGRVFYPGYDRILVLDDGEGHRVEVPPLNVPGDSAGFTVVEEELDRKGLLFRPTLGDANCLRFLGKYALLTAVSLLQRDSGVLLCHNPGCGVCRKSREILTEKSGVRQF
jgi:aminoglycoside 3-N-acetyltransferase